MGNKVTSTNEYIAKQSDRIYKKQRCLRHIIIHPKLKTSQYFFIYFESVSDTIPCIRSNGIIGAEFGKQIFDSSFMSSMVLMHVDNRWKYKHKNLSINHIFCCWFLRIKKCTKNCVFYNLHYLQIIDENTIFVTFKLVIFAHQRPKSFKMSPNLSHLLIFGEGTHFMQLPHIYNDIIQKQLISTKRIKKYFDECIDNLFFFESFSTISMTHFLNDHLLIYSNHYDSSIGIAPCEQRLQLLDVHNFKYTKWNNSMHGTLPQFVASGHNLIIFACGQHTKYAPTHLVRKQQQQSNDKQKNHLWVYRINEQTLQTKVIGHNYCLSVRILSDWKHCSAKIIKRKRNKFWLIAFANSPIDSFYTQDIVIFDVPSCQLIWSIPQKKFDLAISPGVTLSPQREKHQPNNKMFSCAQGIVVKRTCLRKYGNCQKEEADFALHPVPFWTHDQLIEILQPFVEYIDGIIDIVMLYISNPSLDEYEILSNLRYIPSSCMAVCDGLDDFVILSSYMNKEQMNQIGKDVQLGIMYYKHLLFKMDWKQLLKYECAPRTFFADFNAICNIDEPGSYLSACHSILQHLH